MPSLSFSAPPTHTVTAPEPVSLLVFNATLNFTGFDRNQQPQVAYFFIDRSVSVTIGGVLMPDVQFVNGPVVGTSQYSSDTGILMDVRVAMHRYLIEEIESRRKDDIAGSVDIRGLIGRVGQVPDQVGCNTAIKFSEKEWIEVLGKSGYRAGWTAYIERGEVEGWTEVASHVTKAHDRLLSRDPSGVLVECRAAIRAAEKVVNPDWRDISTQIDRGSTPESSFKLKSERVEKLREWILNMADTGGHSENYNATSEDADFVYGLTVDLLAYLSRKEAHAERSRKP